MHNPEVQTQKSTPRQLKDGVLDFELSLAQSCGMLEEILSLVVEQVTQLAGIGKVRPRGMKKKIGLRMDRRAAVALVSAAVLLETH